jgi:cellulose synthase/poly-beta-1,6-N-acetylglucosamine synthase-like glycosyltransferase
MTKQSKSPYNYAAFSQLTGRFAKLTKKPYKIGYKKVSNKKEATRTLLLALLNVGVEVGFLTWLLVSLLTPLFNDQVVLGAAFAVLLASIFVIEFMRLVSIISFAFSALVAKDPIPVRPERGKRVAFTTAIVPSKEPFEMVAKTLEAMKKVHYDGEYDVWLLDEGNDPVIKQACRRMGVKHFSRRGVPEWNMPTGRYKAKTKHGNFNAWLMAHGVNYDYVLSVDSDHVPHRNFAERMLGYFRDPDVAFVVGPQVYGNMESVITRGAESQSYVFQATIQRAANTYDAAMFVGTNHAYRVSSILEINGFQDSITEDLLTSLTLHSSRNPATGNFWKSVYTPDVLAVGEGPSSWTDFFSQQVRWSRGANEILLKNFWKLFFKLPGRARLHYGLIVWCYPAAAITWTIGIAVSMLYLFLGTTGVGLQDKTWLALYADVLAAQLFLYAWLRRYNVSPHEPKGSFGIAGIIFSIFAAPIYAYAFFSTLLRRKAGFVVTPKGDTISPDTWRTFKHHLFWSTLVGGFLAYCLFIGNTHPNVKIWCALTLTASLTPVLMWQISMWPATRQALSNLFRLPRRAVNSQTLEGASS